MLINRSKKGPFMEARKDLLRNDWNSDRCHGVDYFVFTSHGSRRKNKYTGFSVMEWKNIKREVTNAHDVLSGCITEAIQDESNAEIFQDYLSDMFLSFKIED